jgi:hypothetical protein
VDGPTFVGSTKGHGGGSEKLVVGRVFPGACSSTARGALAWCVEFSLVTHGKGIELGLLAAPTVLWQMVGPIILKTVSSKS